MNRVVGAGAVVWLATLGLGLAQSRYAGTLDPRVEASAYPAPTSDIAALMVFDHEGR